MNGSLLTLTDISFLYQSSPAPLFHRLHAAFPQGWTGIVGANGTGKTTLLRIAAGELTPTNGRIDGPGDALYCPQRTDEPPPLMEELLEAEDGEAHRLRGALSISPDWLTRWDTLSHGERKRCQIAAALWRAPDILAVDEPTNHVDFQAKTLLLEAMKGYRGVGLLVSHDRELLDGLCRSCLFLEPAPAWGGAPAHPVMRRGNYSEAAAALKEENLHARERFQKARAEARSLERAAAEKKREASQTRARLSKRGIARGDQDSKSRIDAARISGKDAVSARRYREASLRLDRAREDAAGMAAGRVRDPGLRIESMAARRDTMFRIAPCAVPLGGGGAGDSGGAGSLEVPELVMYPQDRIGLTGPNGAGKSTLIRRIMGAVSGLRTLYLPQEIDAGSSRRIIEEVRALPAARLGRVMTAVGLLGTDPERLLSTDEPSPGEIRKVLIAGGIAEPPELIVMDEPTNHLDLPSVECLTEALQGSRCALLLVSHDMRFLDEVTTMRWRIEPAGAGRDFVLTL